MSVERTSGLPSRWDEEADVVVVGSGGAALAGAVTAANEGALVLVLEKAPKVGGTTAKSGGGIWIADNHHMPEVGVDDSRDDALGYLRAICGEPEFDEMLETIVDRGKEMVSYMEAIGVLQFEPYPGVGGTLDYRPWVPGARYGGRALSPGNFDVSLLGGDADLVAVTSLLTKNINKLDFYRKRLFQNAGAAAAAKVDSSAPVEDESAGPWYSNGTALIAFMLKGALDRGARVYTSARVTELAVEDGEVIGVRAIVAGADRWFRARAGVLLACGGFENNAALRRAFLTRPLDLTCGVKTNEGDGHLMGMAIGAQLANVADAWWQMAARVIDESGEAVSVHVRAERATPHSIIVNRRGERFMNEATNYYDATEPFGSKQNGTPNLPAYLVLDQVYRDKYPLLSGAPQSAPGTEPAWLVTASSLRELAAKVDIDADGLERSVARFNEHARTGVDPDFGRGGNEWDIEWGDPDHGPNPSLGTIDKAPFYAVEMRAGAMGTKGGLEINPRAEVLSAATGAPIPGLYAAGNTSSGAVPHAYAGPGATLGPALTFGYVAGLELAARCKKS